LRAEFPGLVSYGRFVELMALAVLPLCVYLHHRLAACSGISFIDATAIPVCHNRRIQRHKVFADLAQRGKTSMGWFYGFKLHLIVNDRGATVCSRVAIDHPDPQEYAQSAVAVTGQVVGAEALHHRDD
jgi:hypothetical protein